LVIVPQPIPQNGLVAYYPFNGNANDESGNKIHGTVYGAALTIDRFGRSEKAYYFNGLDTYIVIESYNILNMKNTFTLSAWVNFPMIPENGSHIMNKSSFWGIFEYGFNLNTEKNNALSAIAGGSANIIEVFSDSVCANTWYNVTATWEYPGEFILYLDGIIKDRKNTTGSISTTNSPITIGRSRLNYPTDSYNGIIDDIRIYNRVLTESEIQNLYHEGGWNK
jgi:hypothetical protein